MEAKPSAPVLQGRGELVGPMDATAMDDHDHLWAGFAKDAHDLMDILAQLLGIKVGHNLIEDFRGAILDRADDVEQYAAGDATPRAIPHPRLAFEGLLAFDLTRAQRACREA